MRVIDVSKSGLVVGAFAVMSACSGSGGGVDLGQVLDRTEYAVTEFDQSITAEAAQKGVTQVQATDAQLETFNGFLTAMMNASPAFYSQPIGTSVQSDASFLGFEDKNANGTQESGEKKLFTLEIDSENGRLIATDETGVSTYHHPRVGGFFTGMIIGNMLSRQRAAGIAPGSFNNRSATPRSDYKPPRSRVRSGGSRAGK